MIYTSVEFDRQRVAEYTLLIQVGTYENTLAVLDHEKQLRFAATYDPLKPEKKINDILGLSFGEVKVAVPDSQYTFVPADAFDEDSKDTYLRYLPDDGITRSVVSDIAPLGVKLLHQTSLFGLEGVSATFPARRIYPAIQSLLISVAGYRQSTDDSLLIVNKQESKTTICCFKAGRFIYCNDFEVNDANDLTYYLIAVKAHLELPDQWRNVLLSGAIENKDAYYQAASQHGGYVELVDSGLLTGITMPADLLPHQHRFLTLLALDLCE